jgi:oligopeptide transport system ATP-binding protein
MKNYPHQLSGGMRQRVVIAIAISCNPDVLICDEPTTALDVTIQARILELVKGLQERLGISVIYITHDLGVVAKVADFISVMYAGRIVETGTTDEVFYDPRHPYTWGLLSAMPDLDTSNARLYSIPGNPPNMLGEKRGDPFAPRNEFALNIDRRLEPPMFKITDTHYAATWLLHERAPKVDILGLPVPRPPAPDVPPGTEGS